jgi:hypothetical protein
MRIALVVLFALLPATPQAQSGGTFRISQPLVASGGGIATGAALRLEGTIAQVSAGPLPGGRMTGGAFRLRGGFWPPDDGPAGELLFANGFE